MKQKTLSQQLVEIAEITPAYTITYNVGDLDTNYQKFSNKSKFGLIREHFYEFHRDPNDDGMYGAYIGDIREEYPDFESDTDEARYNFMLLLQFDIDLFGRVELLKPEMAQRYLLKIIIKRMNSSKELHLTYSKFLQNTKWRY